MFNQSFDNRETSQPRHPAILEGLGIVLVLCGLGVAGWVIFNIILLFTHPEELARFTIPILETLQKTASSKEFQSRAVVLSELLSPAIPIMLLGIAAIIAGTLISGGANLAYGSYQRFLMRVARMEDKTIRAVDSVKLQLKESAKECRKKDF